MWTYNICAINIYIYIIVQMYLYTHTRPRVLILYIYIDPKRSVLSPRYNRCRADRDLVTRRKDVNQTTAAKRDLLIWDLRHGGCGRSRVVIARIRYNTYNNNIYHRYIYCGTSTRNRPAAVVVVVVVFLVVVAVRDDDKSRPLTAHTYIKYNTYIL